MKQQPLRQGHTTETPRWDASLSLSINLPGPILTPCHRDALVSLGITCFPKKHIYCVTQNLCHAKSNQYCAQKNLQKNWL